MFYNKNTYIPFLKKYNCPIGEVPMKWEVHKSGKENILLCFDAYNYSCDNNKILGKICNTNGFSGIELCRMDCINPPSTDPSIAFKPIIYLYPEQETQIKVELEVEGEIIADYPIYNEEIRGWDVLAYPDSTIIDDKKEYSYLFWEAEFENNDWNLSKGFIVEGKDAREFLEEKLSYIGLTPREYNEFIVYWYPLMMNNKYNLVYFAGLDYISKAPLKITPEPDSILRVFTVIKPLEEKIDLPEQELEIFYRKGFSVVEWGGTIIK